MGIRQEKGRISLAISRSSRECVLMDDVRIESRGIEQKRFEKEQGELQ